MPFIDGKRVTNDEWIATKTGPAVDWKEAFDYKYGDEEDAEALTTDESAPEPEPEPIAKSEQPPAPQRRGRNSKAQAEAAIAEATGLTLDLDDSLDEDTAEQGRAEAAEDVK